MGLRDLLFKPKPKQVPKQHMKPQMMKPQTMKPRMSNCISVRVPNVAPLDIPMDGNCNNTVYTYDGRPISGIKKGEVFRLDLVPGDVPMRSIYTGYEAIIEYNHNLCVSYRGLAIGYYGGSLRKMVKESVDIYGHVTIAVIHNGFDTTDGWPKLNAFMPSYSWFIERGITGDPYSY